MKIVSFTEDEDVEFEYIPEEEFDHMVAMQNKISTLGLTVPVIDSWKCDTSHGVIVMKRLHQPLSTLLPSIKKCEDRVSLLRSVYMLFDELRKSNLTHGDLKLVNIMFDSMKYHQSAIPVTFDDTHGYLYLIDFQFSYPMSDQRYHEYKELDGEAIYQITKVILGIA